MPPLGSRETQMAGVVCLMEAREWCLQAGGLLLQCLFIPLDKCQWLVPELRQTVWFRDKSHPFKNIWALAWITESPLSGKRGSHTNPNWMT